MRYEDLEVTLAFAGASGNKDALYRLGEICAQGGSVPRDADKAREYFQKAAEEGSEKETTKVKDLTELMGWVDGNSI